MNHSLKIKNLKLKIIGLLIILLCSGSITEQVFAQSLLISPPKTEVSLIPGHQTEGEVHITNTSDTPLTVSLSAQDFVVKEKGIPVFNVKSDFLLASWIGITPDRLTISPQDSESIYYYIKIPQNAEPGGHYAAIVVSPLSAESSSSASIQTEVATLIEGVVPGSRITNWTTTLSSGKKWYEHGPLDLVLHTTNEGNIHTSVSGSVELRNIFGTTVHSQSISKTNIFPKTSLDQSFSMGAGFLWGPYTATVKLQNSLDNSTRVQRAVVWVVPWKLLAAAFLGLAVLISVIVLVKRKPSIPTEISN